MFSSDHPIYESYVLNKENLQIYYKWVRPQCRNEIKGMHALDTFQGAGLCSADLLVQH